MAKTKLPRKKKPSDYPLIQFRVSAKDKKRLTAMLEKVANELNHSRPKDSYKIRMNDVLVRAIERGLPLLKASDFDEV